VNRQLKVQLKKAAAKSVAQTLQKLGWLKEGERQAPKGVLVTEKVVAGGESIEMVRFSDQAKAKIYDDLKGRWDAEAGTGFFDKVNGKKSKLNLLIEGGASDEIIARELGITGDKVSGIRQRVEGVLEELSMVNNFSSGLNTEMTRTIDKTIRAQNVEAEGAGGRYDQNVSVPTANGTANFGQSFSGDMSLVMEFVGAVRAGETPNIEGLHTTDSKSFKSTVNDYLADVFTDPRNSVAAVTGTLGGNRGVVETALGMRIHGDSVSITKIIGEIGGEGGALVNEKNSYGAANNSGRDQVIIDAYEAGKFAKSQGMEANGNLKVAMTNKNEDPLEVARAVAKGKAKAGEAEATYFVQQGDGSYMEMRIKANGEVVSGSEKPIAIDQIQNRYTNGEKNLVTIIGRGGATGDSILTAKSVPFLLITAKGDPAYTVAQAGARGNRTGNVDNDMSTTSIVVGEEVTIGGATAQARLKSAQDGFDFVNWKKELVAAEEKLNKINTTRALDNAVGQASVRSLVDLIRVSTDAEVTRWVSEKILNEFSNDTGGRNLSDTEEAQLTIARRNELANQESARWQKMMADLESSNPALAQKIKRDYPDIYERMQRNAKYEASQCVGYWR
jgi:hypothetical protein